MAPNQIVKTNSFHPKLTSVVEPVLCLPYQGAQTAIPFSAKITTPSIKKNLNNVWTLNWKLFIFFHKIQPETVNRW